MMVTVRTMATLLRGRGMSSVSEEDIVRVGKNTKKIVLEEERSGFNIGPVPQSMQKGRCTLAIQPATLSRQDVQSLIPQFPILHTFLTADASLLTTFDDERVAKSAFLELQGKKFKGTAVIAKVRLEQFLHVIYSNQTVVSYPAPQARKQPAGGGAAGSSSVNSQQPPVVPMPMMPSLFSLPFLQPFGMLPMPMPTSFPTPTSSHNVGIHNNTTTSVHAVPIPAPKSSGGVKGKRAPREFVIPTPASGQKFRPPVPKEPPGAAKVPPSPDVAVEPSPISPLTSQKFRLDPYSFVRGTVQVKERPSCLRDVVTAAASGSAAPPESRESPTNAADTGSGGPSSSNQSPPVSPRFTDEKPQKTAENDERPEEVTNAKPLSYAAMLMMKPKKATDNNASPKAEPKEIVPPTPTESKERRSKGKVKQ